MRWIPAVAALAVAAGCSTYTVPRIKQVQVDESRLDTRRAMPALACSWRLAAVTDGRPTGGDTGRLDRNVLHLEDAPGVVARQLHDAGLLPAGSATGHAVAVELKQMYMGQMYEAKMPTVVYGVRAEGGAPFVVRSEATTLNWWGSKGEAHAGYARALADASYRLVLALNQRCPKG